MSERTALANVEAEAALLGALMIENALIDRACDIVQPDDFSEAVHGRIYSLLVRERSLGRHANPVTLPPFLADDPAIADLGGTGYLAQLTGSGASMIGAMDFARQIGELAKRRRLVEGLDAATALAGDLSTTTEQIVDAADAAIVEAGATADTIHQVTGAQCIDELFASYEDPSMGVTCGIIPQLDEVLGEMRPKQLVIGAGRPGMGKTAVALSYALGAASRGHGVLFISLEMSSTELAQRMVADLCFDGRDRVPFHLIRDNKLSTEQRRTMARARARLAEMPFHVIDAGHMTIGRMAMLVRRYKRRLAARGQSLDLVVVDYLQLLSADRQGRSQYEAVSDVSRGLKAAAKENGVAIFALAQLSRKVEERTDKRPLLWDLRDSGQIEQDADAALFLYREEYYLAQGKPAETDPRHAGWQEAMEACAGRIDFIVAKRRNGSAGSATGTFFGAYQAVRGARA